MKTSIRLIALVIACLMTAACGNKTTTTDTDMNTLSFDGWKQSCLSLMACNAASGDQSTLAEYIDHGFEAGLTANQIKEALSHLYAYIGFPRSLNALGTLQRVIEQRLADGKTVEEGPEASPLPAGYDALKQGTEVQTKVSGRAFDYAFCPAEDYYLKAHLFGDIFARDVLTHADRELVTVSALCGMDGVMPQLQAHLRGALNMGVPEDDLRGLPNLFTNFHMDAAAARCKMAISAVLDGDTTLNSQLSTLHLTWPLGEPNTAFAQYFTGNSYLAILDGGLCNVTFEPGCRNNWHIHHGAVQVLVCISGRGWYQEWGEPAIELKPGVTVAIPEGAKHWHGAAADSWMQHLTYHTDTRPGNSTEWLEPVTDEQYNKM